jgi:hypothetical protein
MKFSTPSKVNEITLERERSGDTSTAIDTVTEAAATAAADRRHEVVINEGRLKQKGRPIRTPTCPLGSGAGAAPLQTLAFRQLESARRMGARESTNSWPGHEARKSDTH